MGRILRAIIIISALIVFDSLEASAQVKLQRFYATETQVQQTPKTKTVSQKVTRRLRNGEDNDDANDGIAASNVPVSSTSPAFEKNPQPNSQDVNLIVKERIPLAPTPCSLCDASTRSTELVSSSGDLEALMRNPRTQPFIFDKNFMLKYIEKEEREDLGDPNSPVNKKRMAALIKAIGSSGLTDPRTPIPEDIEKFCVNKEKYSQFSPAKKTLVFVNLIWATWNYESSYGKVRKKNVKRNEDDSKPLEDREVGREIEYPDRNHRGGGLFQISASDARDRGSDVPACKEINYGSLLDDEKNIACGTELLKTLLVRGSMLPVAQRDAKGNKVINKSTGKVVMIPNPDQNNRHKIFYNRGEHPYWAVYRDGQIKKRTDGVPPKDWASNGNDNQYSISKAIQSTVKSHYPCNEK